MKITFTTSHIKGKGRGKTIGYPTMNLAIPYGFSLPEGIYAVWVTINNKKFPGALHWGPIPTFHEKEKSLEVFIIDKEGVKFPKTYTCIVTIDIIKKIRAVKQFSSIDELTAQIARDIFAIKKTILKYDLFV
jgi:riboflavin kinase/FMN adenylyltransferase